MLSNAMLPIILCDALQFYAIINLATLYHAMLFHSTLGHCFLTTTWYHPNGTCYQALGLASSTAATGNVHRTTRYHNFPFKTTDFT